MLNLASWLRRFGTTGRKATKIYGSIVTQARDPVFYREVGVADTPTGRCELLALHLSLVLNVLREAGDNRGNKLARALVEHFVTDMDDSMREMAVGDMSVPRKVKKVAAGLMDRSQAYRKAITSGAPLALDPLLAENLELPDRSEAVKRLAQYVIKSSAALQAQQAAILERGIVKFATLDAASST